MPCLKVAMPLELELEQQTPSEEMQLEQV